MTKPALPTTKKRAADMLQAMLAQVSAIRIKTIEFEAPVADSAHAHTVDLRAHIDIYGHSHTLLCKVRCSNQHGPIREAIEKLYLQASGLSGSVIPLLIAPCLSPHIQAMCRERDIGYLDMEGNLRLVLDETFILRHSQPCRAALAQRRSARVSSGRRGFPPGRTGDLAAGAATAHRMAS